MNRPLSLSAALSSLACVALLAGCAGSDSLDGDDTPLPDQDFWAVTTGGSIVRLDNDGLNAISTQPLTGMAVGETVLGADFRPATGQFYVLGSTGQLYTVDTTTSTATPVGAPLVIAGAAVGFDFNPSVDRIRIISSTGENMRVHPDTGALVAADTTITPAGVYVGAAYTPAGAGAPTTLFALEVNGSQFGRIGGPDGSPSPNGGVFTQLDVLGINISTETHFDIDSRGNGYLTTWDGAATRMYFVNLEDGELEEQGNTTLRLAGMGIIP
jgi:hypothetical protein